MKLLQRARCGSRVAFPSRERKEPKGETDRQRHRMLVGGGGVREVKRQLHCEVTSAEKEIGGPWEQGIPERDHRGDRRFQTV